MNYICHRCGKPVKMRGTSNTLARHKAAEGYQGFSGWTGGILTTGWCIGGGENPCNIVHEHPHPADDPSKPGVPIRAGV